MRDRRQPYAAGLPAPRAGWLDKRTSVGNTVYHSQGAAEGAVEQCSVAEEAPGPMWRQQVDDLWCPQPTLFEPTAPRNPARAHWANVQILEGWVVRCEARGGEDRGLNYGRRTAQICRRFLRDMDVHFGTARPQHLDRWLTRFPNEATRRINQSTVGLIFEFARDPDYNWAPLMEEAHGSVPPRLVNDLNRIRHVDLYHEATRRPVRTEEMEKIDREFERRIAQAGKDGVKGRLALIRDRCAIDMMPVVGQRASEATARQLVIDWGPDPKRPDRGALGGVSILGKAHDGQPPPYEFVAALPGAEPQLHQLAQWLQEYRPEFLHELGGAVHGIWRPGDPYPLPSELCSLTQGPVFPSARRELPPMSTQASSRRRPTWWTRRHVLAGGRAGLTPTYLARRWAQIRGAADVDESLTLHCLRYRFAVDLFLASGGHSLEPVRDGLRHMFISTTAIYLAGMDKEIRLGLVREYTSRFEPPHLPTYLLA